MVDQWGMLWHYSDYNRCIFNWDPSSQEPLESCGWWLWPRDVQFGKHCTVNFVFPQLPPTHGWFPKYSHLWLLPSHPSLACCLAHHTATLDSESWRQNFPSSLCDITNYNVGSFRHPVMVTSFLICSIIFCPTCCHFSSRIWESGFSCLHCRTIAVVFSHGIGAFFCPPFLSESRMIHCHPWFLFFQIPGTTTSQPPLPNTLVTLLSYSLLESSVLCCSTRKTVLSQVLIY